MDHAIANLTERAINVWQAGNDISLDLAVALMALGVDVISLERKYVR